MNPPIRLMIADDHPLVRNGLRALLSAQSDLVIVGEAGDGATAVDLWRELEPDMAFLDLRMPKLDGIETAAKIRVEDPEARVVILTTLVGDDDIWRALRAGVKGYLPKDVSVDDIVDCVRTVSRGGSYFPASIEAKLAAHSCDDTLTEREGEVLRHIAVGSTNKRIARELDIGEGTVKTHLKHVFAKLYVRNRTEAVAIARRRGMLNT